MTLYQDLTRECAANNNFLPLALINTYITEERVTDCLDSKAIPSEPAQIERILGSRRLFAVLVLLRREQDVHTILAHVDDSMIPFLNLEDVSIEIGNHDQRADFLGQQDTCPPPLTCHTSPQTIRRPPFKERTYWTSGGFGVVYKVKVAEGHLEQYDSNEYMACKEILIRRPVEKILREVITLIKRRHKHIVPLVACFLQPESEFSDGSLNLLFPWADRVMDRWMTGNTPKGLEGNNGPRLRKEYLYETILSLLSAVSYLHREIDGHVTSHHDLKPENILLVGKTWMIGDFGKSHMKELASGSTTAGEDHLGSFEYQPPEYANRTVKKFKRSFDIWSMGCIIVELAVLIAFGRETNKLEKFKTARAKNQVRPSSFKHRSRGDTSFHNNMEVVDQWMKELEDEDGSRNYGYLMKTARAMLSPNEGDRPYAWEVYLDLYEHFHPDEPGSARRAKIKEFVPRPTSKEINYPNNPLTRAIARKDLDRMNDLRTAGWTRPGYEDGVRDIFAYEEIVRLIECKPSRDQIIQLFIRSYQTRHKRTNTYVEGEKRHCMEQAQRFAELILKTCPTRFTAAEIKHDLDQTRPMSLMAVSMGYIHRNHTDKDQNTPLYSAASEGEEVTVEILLRYRAKVDPVNHISQTPLSIASTVSHDLVVERLLQESGVQINFRDGDGRTPLYLAAEYGCYRVAQLLLERGANPEVADGDGGTPLSQAAWQGNIEMVELLLKHGADPTTRDLDHASPLTLAVAEFKHRWWKGVPEDRFLDFQRVIEKLSGLDSVDESVVERLLQWRNKGDPRP